MAFDPQQTEGLGVPEHMLQPGAAVMVPYVASAVVNGDPALICYATVRGLASEADAASFNGGPWYWLDVHTGGGVTLPQMFRSDQILGVPALGLLPPTAVVEYDGGEPFACASIPCPDFAEATLAVDAVCTCRDLQPGQMFTPGCPIHDPSASWRRTSR